MTLYLHIGSPKTGTTSIQRFFGANRTLLRKNGFVYPKFPGIENHTKLATYAHEEGYHPNDLRAGVNSPETRADFRRRFAATFRERLQETEGHLLFSSEHCGALLNSEQEIAILHDLLAQAKTGIKVIFYARQQVEFLASQYSTNIINGRIDALRYPSPNNIERNFNYYALLRRWESVFGREAIIARVFDRSKLAGGDVVRDICEVIGLSERAFAAASRPERLNESLDGETIEFMRLLNKHLPPVVEQNINPDRGNIGALVQRISGKERIGIPGEIADRLREELNEPNSLFRQRYIDGVKEDPFSWDSGKAAREAKELDIDTAFKLFARIWALKQAERRG